MKDKDTEIYHLKQVLAMLVDSAFHYMDDEGWRVALLSDLKHASLLTENQELYEILNELLNAEGREEKCTCDEESHEYHSCPYASEINNEERECNCCPHCHQQCADDI